MSLVDTQRSLPPAFWACIVLHASMGSPCQRVLTASLEAQASVILSVGCCFHVSPASHKSRVPNYYCWQGVNSQVSGIAIPVSQLKETSDILISSDTLLIWVCFPRPPGFLRSEAGLKLKAFFSFFFSYFLLKRGIEACRRPESKLRSAALKCLPWVRVSIS